MTVSCGRVSRSLRDKTELTTSSQSQGAQAGGHVGGTDLNMHEMRSDLTSGGEVVGELLRSILSLSNSQ